MKKTGLILMLSAAALLLIGRPADAQAPDVNRIRGLYREALQLRQAGKPREAISRLEEILKIDVLIVITRGDDWVEKLHHHPGSAGGYSPQDQVLSCRKIAAVFHEYTHAMHGADQDFLDQKHPIWIVEGLACHFEAFDIVGGEAVGRSNHRLPLLQQIIDSPDYISWDRMFSMNGREFMADSKTCYAESGFIIRYLQEKGLLEKWYAFYCETYPQDPTGISSLEEVFGKDMEKIEAGWKEWVKTLPQNPRRTPGS